MRKPEPAVTVLLSVRNGERFLEEFLDSLRSQSEQDFLLLVRDDASTDGSPDILRRCERAVLLDDREPAGVVGSFGRLLQAATGRYLMFADQDDVWHPDKIAETLSAMRQAEAQQGERHPILVHSDLRVCDERLNELHPSLAAWQGLPPRRCALRELMVQNNVTGCTVMINRALADLAAFPEEAICHDWFLALTAAAFGEIVYLRRPLIDYRRHGGNVYGPVRYDWRSPFRLFRREELRQRLHLTQRQARAFARHYAERLDESQREMLESWAGCETEEHYGKRLAAVWKHRFAKSDFLRTLGLWWAI